MQFEVLSATQIGKLVNSKEVSPVEIVRYFIDRINSRGSATNAFTYTRFEDALNEARKLEERLIQGEYCGPFAGAIVGLKDFLPSKTGWTNSHGGVKSLICEDSCDSEFYKAAKTLGAIAIGKTNAPAFGFSGACQNKLYGATTNPFDVTRTSGGSSGGSAAAVADGLLHLAEGGDAGGSIRIPSSWCNLFGFKPSLGTVPSYCRPDGWTATHPYCFNGALTKTVEDSATILNEMAYYNSRDPISLPINASKDFVTLMERSIKGKRIGLTFDFDLYPVVDREIKQIIQNAADILTEAGAVVEDVHFNWKHSVEDIMYCWAWAISVDTSLDLMNWKQENLDLIADHRDELPEEFIYFSEISSKVGIVDFRQFNEIRTDILDNFENVFDTYDLILSPVTICKPLPLKDGGRCISVDNVVLDPLTNFISFGETPLANFVGYPAASVPAGFTSEGLPTGMQLIGRKYCDEDIFAVARTFEQLHPWSYDQAYNRK